MDSDAPTTNGGRENIIPALLKADRDAPRAIGGSSGFFHERDVDDSALVKVHMESRNQNMVGKLRAPARQAVHRLGSQRERKERVNTTEKKRSYVPLYVPPPALAKIVGEAEIQGGHAGDRLWEYAEENGLITEHGTVECDDVLSEALGGVTTVQRRYDICLLAMEQLTGKKYVPAKRTPPMKYPLSMPFQSFLGTGEKEMDVSTARTRVRVYILKNNLLDKESGIVNCDEKLQKLFKCSSTPYLDVDQRFQIHLLGRRFQACFCCGPPKNLLSEEELKATIY